MVYGLCIYISFAGWVGQRESDTGLGELMAERER
jgi:hypothetical protein